MQREVLRAEDFRVVDRLVYALQQRALQVLVEPRRAIEARLRGGRNCALVLQQLHIFLIEFSHIGLLLAQPAYVHHQRHGNDNDESQQHQHGHHHLVVPGIALGKLGVDPRKLVYKNRALHAVGIAPCEQTVF